MLAGRQGRQPQPPLRLRPPRRSPSPAAVPASGGSLNIAWHLQQCREEVDRPDKVNQLRHLPLLATPMGTVHVASPADTGAEIAGGRSSQRGWARVQDRLLTEPRAATSSAPTCCPGPRAGTVALARRWYRGDRGGGVVPASKGSDAKNIRLRRRFRRCRTCATRLTVGDLRRAGRRPTTLQPGTSLWRAERAEREPVPNTPNHHIRRW